MSSAMEPPHAGKGKRGATEIKFTTKEQMLIYKMMINPPRPLERS